MKLPRPHIRRYILQSTLIISAFFAVAGCQKIINVDLNTADPQIVIEGLMTDGNGPFAVSVSKSGSYFNQTSFLHVTGAEVIISDNAGTTDTLSETNPGIYLTSKIRGVEGRTYILKVRSENKEYTATSTLPEKVPVDTLILVKDLSTHIGFGGGAEVREHVDVHCLFYDPDEKNYYRVRVYKNDTTNIRNYRLYDDQYTNGEYTELRVTRAEEGDRDRVELISLDRGTYLYYSTLEDVINTNPVFGSTPANPITNLDNGALGYFGACAISSRTIFITRKMIDNAH